MASQLTSFALALALLLPASGWRQAHEQKPDQNPDAPRFKVEVFGDAMADFSARVSAYAELRQGLMKGLPALTVGSPADVRTAVHALAERIRVARANAKQGDIFTPTISREMKTALVPIIDRTTWADLVDDNPGEFAKKINGSYPETRPFSTVPANILAILPRLPDDIEYRFLGPHLCLLDTRANLIIDWIPYAIVCAASDDKSDCPH
jgi:hypothetical protein